jgi:asparagine synthase (glutamine-hydrolysing)
MCGICGSTRDPQGEAVAAMNAGLTHRGPDDSGTYTDSDAGVALGARRLSIIDPVGGHQPLSNEDGSVWAVMNGEIYNHPRLLERLRRRGHRLGTACDTEVLVHLYEDFGDALVHALEGMYAFAIWDARRRRLLLGRDRFGEKPLFYAEPEPGVLAFASELRPLLSGSAIPFELDRAALDRFFVYGYLPGPGTMVEGVRQLPAGTTLSWSAAEARVQLRRYWSPQLPSRAMPAPFEELVAETRALLETAVRSRLISDVPLGVFLSGGLDSTLIATIAARLEPGSIETFSVGYETGNVDERDIAAATARELRTEHHELVLEGAELHATAARLLSALDQPIADPALVALYALSSVARRRVKVAVGGEGADELFGGYPRYRWLARSESIRLPAGIAAAGARALELMPLDGRARRLATVLRPASTVERHLEWVTSGRPRVRARIYGPALRETLERSDLVAQLAQLAIADGGDAAARHMLLDQQHWLVDDVLSKADRAGMLASLEIRTPYLHRELTEFAASVPARVHLQSGGKALLRAVLREELPSSRRKRAKRAFHVPLGDWLRGPLKPLLDAQLESGRVFAEGVFDRGAVRALAAAHDRGGQDHSQTLWPVLCLGEWLDSWNGRDAV